MDIYLLVKSLHVVAIISWMAGLLYLPRIYVYHSELNSESDTKNTFKIMEYRLYKYIMNPAMILSIITGLYLGYSSMYYKTYWLNWKFLLVFFMIIYHIYLSYLKKQFYNDKNNHSSRFFRILNEVPTLLMFGIVFLVILKPF